MNATLRDKNETMTHRLKYSVATGSLAYEEEIIELEAKCSIADSLEKIAAALAAGRDRR